MNAHIYDYMSLLSDRDLWGAMCQRRGTGSAVCPHGARIHCDPWTATRWRHTEQVRDTKCVWGVNLDPASEHNTMSLLSRRRNCIISAYYQQRETHKTTLPNVSINWTCSYLHFWCFLMHISCVSSPCVQGSGGSWEAPLVFTSSDPESVYYCWCKKTKKQKNNCFPHVWNRTTREMINRQGCMFTLCQQGASCHNKYDLMK